MAFKRLEAIIRPEKLELLRASLEKIGYPGMTVTEVQGHGKQRGVEQQWRGSRYKTYFIPKIKIEVVVLDRQLGKLVAAILDVCGSGNVGDGKIFISDVTEVVRIRTKERAAKAL